MMPIDDPVPRNEALPWAQFNWPVRRPIASSRPPAITSARFLDVIQGRRSERYIAHLTVGRAMEVLQLSSQLSGERMYQGVSRHRSPVISAGGLHGIDTIFGPITGYTRLFRFNRKSGGLESLRLADAKYVRMLRGVVKECLPFAQGMCVGFIADTYKYISTYEHSESLIWRDSGALLQVMSMASYALGIGACPLGPHGNQLVRALGIDEQRFISCGLIVIGKYS